MLTSVLDVVGLVAVVVAGFLLAPWLGFAVFGGGCLLVSYKVTRARKVEQPRPLRAVA